MKINELLIEDLNKNKARLLTETVTYKLWESAGKKIVEAQLTVDQINQLFANIEQSATASGGNRTMIGKGVDATSAVNKAWEDLKTKVQNSGPIKNVDAMYDQAAEKLKQATGGDQGVMKYVQKYRDFAKKHPVAQSLIYGALIAAAGITGAGVGGAAALGLFKMVDKLLQGEKFSSAAYQGAKTGAVAYGASRVGDFFKGERPVTQTSSWKNQDAMDQGFNYASPGGDVSSGTSSWNTTITGLTGDQIRNHSSYADAIAKYGDTVAGRRMAAMAVRNAIAKGQTNEGIELTEATIALLFTRIDEGLWDTLKGKAQQAGSAIASKVQKFGKNLTTKVTADKLMKMWKAAGSPTDSNQLMSFLTQKAGIDKVVVDKVFADMKIQSTQPTQSAAQPAPKAAAQPTAQPAPKAAAQPTAQPASKGSGLNYYATVRNMRKKGMAVGESKKKFSLSDLDYYLQHPEQMSDDAFEREFGMTRTQAEQEFGRSMSHDDEYNMTNDQVDKLLGISNNSNKRRTEYGDPIHESCPHCGGELVSEEDIMEKKDACYYKVKSRYKVWPSAYASGALVQCRKKGAKNWGSKK